MSKLTMPDNVLAIPHEHLVVPDTVEVCAICKGKGSYEQYYNAGCGGGYFPAIGPCDYCHEVGFRYKLSGEPVSDSVIAQIIAQNTNTEAEYSKSPCG